MNIYIHIGYPKTGTTTLQNELFARHDDIFYLNEHIDRSFFQELFYARENHIKRSKGFFREELRKIRIPEGKSVVFSTESFTSYGMFFVHNPAPMVQSIDPNTIARKLAIIFKEAGVFDNVYIFGSIRKQDDLIKSNYAQMYNRYFKPYKQTKNFRVFLEYALANKNNFILDTLQYNSVFEEYESLFGASHVKVFVYEKMKFEEELFYKELASFLQIDLQKTLELCKSKNLNRKSSESGYKTDQKSLVKVLARLKHQFFGKKKSGLTNSPLYQYLNKFSIGGKVLTDVTIDSNTSAALHEFFKDENIKLSQKHDLNLEQYNYFL